MTPQCPRCLSSTFKPLIAGDGNRQNCCGFCAGKRVYHTGFGDHKLVRVEEPPGNVVQLTGKHQAQPQQPR